MQNKMKKQKINIIFNYSNIELTPAMEDLLNRGLNFPSMPIKLNITQVLVNFARFERSMLWQEFWSNKEKQNFKPPIFKKKKTNLPVKHPTPANLKICLNATKSEILDPLNRNKVRLNLPPEEIEALGELIRLQKEKVITIKPCDKGAGIIILNFDDYLKSCNDHLASKQKQENGEFKNYYCKVESDMLETTKEKIVHLIEEGFIMK